MSEERGEVIKKLEEDLKQKLIDGQSVTFLAGIIIGYLLSYLGGYLTPE